MRVSSTRSRRSVPYLVALGAFGGVFALYLLSYGPMWSLATRGTISWQTFQSIYRPVPSRIQSRLFALWRGVEPVKTPATQTLGPAVHQEQEKLETAQRRASELYARLSVPPEVSTRRPGDALKDERLRAYRPYFEAKRECESLQLVTDIIRRRAIREMTAQRTGQ